MGHTLLFQEIESICSSKEALPIKNNHHHCLDGQTQDRLISLWGLKMKYLQGGDYLTKAGAVGCLRTNCSILSFTFTTHSKIIIA